MLEDRDGYVLPHVMAKKYDVTPKTISRWADAGKLDVKWTKNGHRRVREKRGNQDASAEAAKS